MNGWQHAPFQLPEREDEGRIVEAIIDVGEGSVHITGTLEFERWIDDEEAEGETDIEDSGIRTPLFSVKLAGTRKRFSYADINKWRFLEIGTVN
jgi:hypothetical protein